MFCTTLWRLLLAITEFLSPPKLRVLSPPMYIKLYLSNCLAKMHLHCKCLKYSLRSSALMVAKSISCNLAERASLFWYVVTREWAWHNGLRTMLSRANTLCYTPQTVTGSSPAPDPFRKRRRCEKQKVHVAT